MKTPEAKLGAMRECVQAITLRSFHESGAFLSICLTSEAARRFSEESGLIIPPATPSLVPDLEFFLVDKKGYAPERWLFKAQRYLRFSGLTARIAFARRGDIHSGWIKVAGLLAEAGLPVSPEETLGFKIVIAATPQERTTCKVRIVETAGECFMIRYRL